MNDNVLRISANLPEPTIRRKSVLGSRRLSNYLWAFCLCLGGVGFLLAGLSSYFKINLLFFTDCTTIVFIPQGIVMTFYGILAITLSLYVTLTLFWDVGSGYNEFNKKDDLARIVRNGFPGKNEKILLIYSLKDIQSIKLRIQEGINPKREIYMCLKDGRQIPLTSVGQPLPLAELESEASDLAKFLNVNLEGL